MAHREEAAPGRVAPSADPSAPGPQRPPGARSGAVLLAGTLTSNVLSYAFFAVLSRSLTGDDLGAVGSLVNLSVLAAVPALGLQLVAARLVSRSRSAGPDANDAAPAVVSGVMRAATALGLATAVVLAALSTLLAHALHLSPLAVVVLAAAMVPTAVVFAAQGVLQGSERFVALAVVLAAAGVAKFVAAWVVARTGGDVGAVVVLFALGWVVVAGLALALLPDPRGLLTSVAGRGRGRPRHLGRLVAAAVVPTSGLLLLSSLDVLLARHHLAPEASGAYTVGALFEKAAFWGLGFLATLFYPAMAQRSRRRAALVRALGVTAGAGAVGVVLTAALGPWVATLVGGPAYAGLGTGLWRFTALGVCLALVQVIAYAGVAEASTRMGVAMWVAAAAAAALTSAHHADVDAVVDAMLGVAAALVVVGLLIERGSLRGVVDVEASAAVSGRRRARTGPPRR